MSQEGNTFSPQLPESFEYSAALYAPHREFRASLAKIANHIIGDGAPMTFALYGEWGTGKSTALEYLQGLIRKQDNKVTFSWCQAPLWARYQDERSALALQILRGVERGIPNNVADMLARMLQFDLGVARGQSDQDDYDLAASLALLKILESIPHAPPVIEEWIRRSITRNGPIRHVVMLDDLDRCNPEFVARLLKATNHWTTEIDHGERQGAAIYFVLACQEEFLISTQAQAEVKDPRQSLEKYVHVTVNIPRLLNRPADTASYLSMLVGRLTGLPETARESLAAMLDTSARDYPDGLLAPLLRIADHWTTPRAVKTRLNLALTEIDYEQLDDETLVKEWIIKAFWPDFWVNQYRTLVTRFQDPTLPDKQQQTPGNLGGGGIKNLPSDFLTARFQPIQNVGARLRGLLDMSDEALAEALVHVGAEVRADLTDVRPQLAIYLASNPPWPTALFTGGAGAWPTDQDGRARRSDSEKSHGQRALAGYASPPPVVRREPGTDEADTTEAAPQASDGDLPSDPDDQIFFHYLAADAAEDRGEYDIVVDNLNRLLELARRLGATTQRGTDIGNAALIADRTGLYEMALELHHLARAAVPSHFNIMQNYIDFVLDKQITAEYKEARRLYQILLTDGKEHRPIRTLIIGMRLDATINGSIPDLSERRTMLLSALADEPSTNRLIDIAAIPGDILGYDTLRSACQIVIENSENLTSRTIALRVFITALGRSNNPVHEREVVDTARWMIGSGLACQGGDQFYTNALFNLGVQLGSLGYRSASTLIYAEAFELNPTSPDYRRVLASSLEQLNRNEDATAVLLGRTVDTSNIQPETLPEFLSAADGTHRWWEEIAIPKSAPCPTRLSWIIPSTWTSGEGKGGNAS